MAASTTALHAPTQVLDLLVLTFNCAKNVVNVPVFATHLRTALASGGADDGAEVLPDIVAMSLQEVAPMAYGFVGTNLLTPYVNRFDEALNAAASRILARDTPSTSSQRSWRSARPNPYTLVHASNIGYTALLLFARDPRAVKNLQSAEVGFGTADMGNKGAVGARFTYVDAAVAVAGKAHDGDDESWKADGQGPRETEVTFVATHLMHNEWNVPTRNANWATVMRALTFENPAEVLRPEKSNAQGPSGSWAAARHGGGEKEEVQDLLSSSRPGTPDPQDPQDPHSQTIQRKLHALSIYRPTSHLFVAGDLNYRISSSAPPPLATFPNLTAEPHHASHYSNFFPLDQLTCERTAGRTLHGLSEANVTFPPTYKYTVLPQQGPIAIALEEGELPRQLSREERDIGEEVPFVLAPHRWPSWTDRILYLDVPAWVQRRDAAAPSRGPRIEVLKYDALPVVRTSDHRPVFLRARVPLLNAAEMAPPESQDSHEDMAGTKDPRVRLPVEIDLEAWERRSVARRREIVAGWTMWVSTTREGLGVTLVTVAFGLVAWWLYAAMRGAF